LNFDLADIERLPIVKVSVQSLSVSGSPRRSGENSQHVRTLAEVQEGLPPILVHRPSMRVIDGTHRLLAAQMRGDKEIEARFFEGDEDSSYVLAVKSNVAHGLPLSLADRKAAAARIICFYPDWSDRMIASIAGIASNTAASVRAQCMAGGSHPNDEQLDTRVGRDGRRRPQNIGERREFAAKLIQENPRASLREIAKQAGISPETVRGIRSTVIESENSNGEARETDVSRIGTSSQNSRCSGYGSANGNGKKPVLNFLRADPAFRSTDSGRSLLRLLAFPELAGRYSGLFIAQIPPHCLERVAKAALECAAAWQEFASEIERMKSIQDPRGDPDLRFP
jgi:hypothetical protein